MNNRLNIYACSGVGATGDANILDRLVYNLEGSSTLENTVTMNMLLSQINYYRVQYLYGSGSKADTLCRLDKYAVCFWFARKYRDNEKELERIGVNIGLAIASGDFDCESETLEDHEELVDRLIDRIENETGAAENADAAFVAWWNEYVVGMNYPAATEEDQKLWSERISGIGELDKYGIESTSDLSKYLNDSGSYFTYYICLTESQAKRISAKAARKWRKQRQVYQYCYNCFVGFYGTEESMIRIIETGLMETYETDIKTVSAALVAGKDPQGVGSITFTAELIVTIITVIASVLSALITGIINYAKAKVQAKYAVPTNTDSAILSEDDFSEYSGLSEITESSGGLLMLLLAGGTLLYSMFNNKKK